VWWPAAGHLRLPDGRGSVLSVACLQQFQEAAAVDEPDTLEIRGIRGGTMQSAAATARAFDNLASSVRGEVIRRADPVYDEVRKIHNGMIDRKPALIVRCTAPRWGTGTRGTR